MSLGLAYRQGNLLDNMEQFCDRALPERSVYAVLHRDGDRLFADELFADLLSDKGRRSVPPSVVTTVMVHVTCPAGVTVVIARDANGDGVAHFAGACATCPLQEQCTTAQGGRTIHVGRYEHRLADARREQQDPEWRHEYRATWPKVERKLGHMMYRKHGGRRARVRGQHKVDADFNLLAAAHNLARIGGCNG